MASNLVSGKIFFVCGVKSVRGTLTEKDLFFSVSFHFFRIPRFGFLFVVFRVVNVFRGYVFNVLQNILLITNKAEPRNTRNTMKEKPNHGIFRK